jgi:hypothetical protein
MSHLAADALIEAIDGPTVVGSLEGKSMPILTRLPNGKLGFRIMGKFAKSAGPAGILRVTLENGQSIHVGGEQVFFRKGLEEIRGAELAPGDTLEPSWDFRDTYSPPDLPGRRPADGTIRVVSVAPDGEAETFSAPTRETGKFFATCGVLLKT